MDPNWNFDFVSVYIETGTDMRFALLIKMAIESIRFLILLFHVKNKILL